MIKKIFATMFFLVTPLLVQAEGFNLINAQNDVNASTARLFCQKRHRSSGVEPTSSSSSSSSSCSNSCSFPCSEHLRPCRFKQAAYFYLVDDQALDDGASVLWNLDGFTLKSGDIFVNPDPGENAQIIVHDPGIYLITYSVSAENEDDVLPPLSNDTVTFELLINEQPIPGSKYRAFTQSPGGAGTVDVQQINGQVLIYIPADSNVQLANVTGAPVLLTANRDTFPPFTNDGSVVASIYFQKVADQLK